MRRKHLRILLVVLILLNLAFIWGNSVMAGEQSSAVSGSLVALLHKLIPFLPDSELVQTVIRKLAHFSEFALLGMLCSGLAVLERERVPAGLLGVGLAVACMDETIQLYVPGRASSLLDVWIDAAGFAVGLIVVQIGYNLFKNKRVWRKTQ